MPEMTFTAAASAAKMAKIRALLKAKPMTASELAPLLPISRRWVIVYMQHMLDDKSIHIARWTREVKGQRTYLRPVYGDGNQQPNAPKPPAFSNREIKARLRKRMKADPEHHMVHVAKERMRRIERTGPRTDIAARWMFNEVAA